MPTAAPVKKFAQLMGDGSATNIAVTHYLGTKATTAQVYEVATYELVLADVMATSDAVATVKSAAAPASAAATCVRRVR